MSRIDYDFYEQSFNPNNSDRKARRSRKPRVSRPEKQNVRREIQQVADVSSTTEGGLVTTYRPSRFETGYLMQALQGFFDQAQITDVLALVKGGKEANVYRCEADPSTGAELYAAKVYRPRMFRNLRNDKMYREGRALLTAEGHEVHKTDDRILRAVGKKTSYGQQVTHTSWIMYEFTTLRQLFDAGAAVPEPIANTENAILMGYIGDRFTSAPALNETDLDEDEAEPLFNEVLRNIELMLQHGMVHGDLSAYNILYWEGQITLIDFPQVTSVRANRNARFILERDIQRVCEYFERQGVDCDAEAITDQLWENYKEPESDPIDFEWDEE